MWIMNSNGFCHIGLGVAMNEKTREFLPQGQVDCTEHRYCYEEYILFYYLDNIEISEPKKDKPNTIQMLRIIL